LPLFQYTNKPQNIISTIQVLTDVTNQRFSGCYC